MRKGLSYLSITLLALGLTACSNKLNVQAPYKSITVVYGLMDQSDTAHYIRVNKVYEGTGNAYTMAQVYDSIYYPVNQITVQLQDINQNGKLVQTITLVPDSSIPVPPGTFSSPKQILYKTKKALNPNDTYNLIVTNNKTHQVLTGSTTLLPDASFTQGVNGKYFVLPFSSTPSSINWQSSVNGRIYQMTFRFFYTEKTSSGKTSKYIDWVFPTQTAPTITGDFPMLYNVTGYEFLQIVQSMIPVDASVQSRTADSLRMIFTTGSDDFNTYIQLSQPSLGIDQDPPSFSDVKNGIGIYSSRHTQIITKTLSVTQVDSLISYSGTKPLNFIP